MSIITSNASCNPSSISITGKTNGSGTISWSLPTVPAGGTINSCKLTGTCTITDSANKPATVTVNGTSVSSGVAFTINLGTGNTTSSVAVAATGPHKNTKSTITFSNLVYTVDYETNITHTVIFKDWDGTTLKTETVKEGSSATAPTNPTRVGYRFIGWDKDFSSITSDLTVTAQYKEIIEKAICIYSFDSSIDTLPVFNDGYEYRYTDVTNSDGTITRTIFSDIEPTIINFKDCTGLKTLDYMDLTNLIKFDNMFNDCTSLTTVKLENCPANANTVSGFQSMFAGCTSLTHTYLSGINFENATYMRYMFSSCSSLEYVDFGNFNSIHELDFASSFYYGVTGKFNTVVVDNPPANSMNNLIGLLPTRASTLPSGTIIHNATDTSEWDIETLNSRNWQLSPSEEPSEPSSENLFPKFNSDSWAYEEEHEAYLENKKEYDTDVSFETSYYSIYTAYGQLDIIKGKTVKLGVSSIDPNIYIEMGEYRIDNSTLEVIISVGDNESYNLSIRSMSSGYITGSIKGAYLYIIDDLPEITTYTVIFKDWDGTTLKTQNVEDGASATAPDDPTRDGYVFTGWDIDFSNVTNDLIVTAQYEKIEEPDNNELVQGDINDESGAFEDEVSNVVKTKYIDVSDKKQILVNVLTEDVYILKCYLYNANKELVKIIDISADKKRMFGLDLQKLIEEVMNDGDE